MEKPGIYIHIPFCLKKCPYCNFYSVIADRNTHRLFVQTLCDEILQKAPSYKKVEFDTVYIGGGTPNSLESDAIVEILSTLYKVLTFSHETEITLELNPECVTKKDLDVYRKRGIHRLSLGTQSFLDKELAFLGRIHTKEKNLQAIQYIQSFKTFSLSCDIIMGLPEQTKDDLQRSLEYIDTIHPEHLSVYLLTAEEGTPLYSWFQQGIISQPDEERVKELWLFVHEFLIERGYEHYEVSNYSLSGYRSRHNSKYWNNTNYLGFGPSAHSKWGNIRFWNPTSLETYLQKNSEPEFEIITDEQTMDERLMLGLRTQEGFNVNAISKKKTKENFLKTVYALNHDAGKVLLKIDRGFLKATLEGWTVLDTLVEQLVEKLIEP
ncbi:MAG: radical SAM family heme chaperone HemW [Candidatus Marinimicrobia bacterium]|nr:radical SAM family heme chaperone HemW [Candidatus Neomarinimicrobiota bacterium]